jgi:hypothetical protein
MKKYAMIADEDSKLVSVGTGTDTAFYESIGMELMDVEQGYDGNWYVAGYAPKKPEEQVRREQIEAQIAERQAFLDSTDWYVIRYVDTGVAIPVDVRADRQEARAEIEALRNELRW